jgi:hypothetical protein
MDCEAKCLLAGVALLLLLKYVIFGLDAWNGFLHPGRTEPDSLNAFDKPLLGVLG